MADVDLTGNFKTYNINGNLGAKGKFDGMNSTAEVGIGAGAEAMVYDGKAAIDITITPKSVADSFGGFYNTVIDPAVDFVARQDVPGLPEAPSSWNKGIAISGHVEGGFEVSGKFNAGLKVGKGTKNKLTAGGKIGAGPVIGFGGSIGLVLDD